MGTWRTASLGPLLYGQRLSQEARTIPHNTQHIRVHYMRGPRGQDRAPPDADAGGGCSGRTTDFPHPRAELPDGAAWLILGQSFPGLATFAPSPKAPTFPQHLLLLSSLCQVIGAKPHSLCRIRQGRNLPPLPGDHPVLTGYKDKLTAKGKALYTWGRHVSEEWAEPGTRGAGTVCHSDRCAREPGAPRRQVPPLPPTAWGCRPGAERMQVFSWIFTSTRSRRLETEECIITTSLR